MVVELVLELGLLLQLPYSPPETVVLFDEMSVLAVVDVLEVEFVVLCFPVTALVHAFLELGVVVLLIASWHMNHN